MKRIILVLMVVFVSVFLPAQEVKLDMSFAYPLVYSGGDGTNFIRIGLTGFELNAEHRSNLKLNVALVLDVSGSMQGDKIMQAVEAAHHAVDLLKDGDVLSLVTYSDSAYVIKEAAALNVKNRNAFHSAIERIYADGSTALFSGVSLGADQLDKYLEDESINRVVLLSDGLANVGPSTPGELGTLGEILKRRGISVTTLGLGDGYNDELMSELASRSDGNHAFIENPVDLVRIFEKEFGAIMSVAAKDFNIIIKLENGIRPVRLLNRNGDIYEDEVIISLNQLYSNQKQYIILEVEVDPERAGTKKDAAKVTVQYLNMANREIMVVDKNAAISFTDTEEAQNNAANAETLADAVLLKATDNNLLALNLRESGDIEGAKELLLNNADFLKFYGEELDDQGLLDYAQKNVLDSENLLEEDWAVQKKQMREDQFILKNQQIYNKE